MPANVRVGGARVDFSADASGYLTTLRQVESANRGLGAGYAAIGRGAVRQTRFIDQFTSSLRSSLIATVAYAAGVNAVRLAISGSVGGAIDYDRALIRIQKTTDITGERLLRLGDRIRDINTRATDSGRAFGVSTEALLATTEALGKSRHSRRGRTRRVHPRRGRPGHSLFRSEFAGGRGRSRAPPLGPGGQPERS